MFEANMAPEVFCGRHLEGLEGGGISEMLMRWLMRLERRLG
jgi:hypothetical protein